MSTLPVTVVIPTHDSRRWQNLEAAVQSVARQTPPPTKTVIVVDHNEPLYQLAKRHFRDVTVLRNQFGAGVSSARNTGALCATTPLIAFLDDDAVAERDWLVRLGEPLDDRTVAGTGSGSHLAWDRARPGWIPDELLWVYGGSYRGMPTRTARVRSVWAVGMMIRSDAFHAVGGFRANFGKVGDRSRPEDTELCLRISCELGRRWVYVPDAEVTHAVHPNRLGFGYYLNRCFLEGSGQVGMSDLCPQGVLAIERAYLRRTIPRAILRNLAAWSTGRSRWGLPRTVAILAAVGAAGAGAVVELASRHGQRARAALNAVTTRAKPIRSAATSHWPRYLRPASAT